MHLCNRRQQLASYGSSRIIRILEVLLLYYVQAKTTSTSTSLIHTPRTGYLLSSTEDINLLSLLTYKVINCQSPMVTLGGENVMNCNFHFHFVVRINLP